MWLGSMVEGNNRVWGCLAFPSGCVVRGVSGLRQVTDPLLAFFLLMSQGMDLNSAALSTPFTLTFSEWGSHLELAPSTLCVFLLPPCPASGSPVWVRRTGWGASEKRLTQPSWKVLSPLLKHQLLTVLVICIYEFLILHFFQGSNI